MNLGDECCSQRRLAKFVELIVYESEQDAAFTNARVSNNDHLDLR